MVLKLMKFMINKKSDCQATVNLQTQLFFVIIVIVINTIV